MEFFEEREEKTAWVQVFTASKQRGCPRIKGMLGGGRRKRGEKIIGLSPVRKNQEVGEVQRGVHTPKVGKVRGGKKKKTVRV